MDLFVWKQCFLLHLETKARNQNQYYQNQNYVKTITKTISTPQNREFWIWCMPRVTRLVCMVDFQQNSCCSKEHAQWHLFFWRFPRWEQADYVLSLFIWLLMSSGDFKWSLSVENGFIYLSKMKRYLKNSWKIVENDKKFLKWRAATKNIRNYRKTGKLIKLIKRH
jgi:hypothetical protein